MRSRLHEMCEFLDMDGADYRELPTNGGVDDLFTLWKTAQEGRSPRRAAAAVRRGASSATARATSNGRADGRDRELMIAIVIDD